MKHSLSRRGKHVGVLVMLWDCIISYDTENLQHLDDKLDVIRAMIPNTTQSPPKLGVRKSPGRFEWPSLLPDLNSLKKNLKKL